LIIPSAEESTVKGKEVVRIALSSTQPLLSMYLTDLSDADLLVRPVPNANHIAWQLGHLIKSEVDLIKSQVPLAEFPSLPAGFAEQYTKETAKTDSPKNFKTKAQYLDLFDQVRRATLASLDRLTDEDLDKATTGNMAAFAPNLAAFYILVSNHTLMHAGQITAVRRKLGKPVLF
jgi:uncharacterized damage-inducible protein DinB